MADPNYDSEALKKNIEDAKNNIQTFENAIKDEENRIRQLREYIRVLDEKKEIQAGAIIDAKGGKVKNGEEKK